MRQTFFTAASRVVCKNQLSITHIPRNNFFNGINGILATQLFLASERLRVKEFVFVSI